MSASDLFRDSNDADFRLRNTCLVVGRRPYFVLSVLPHPKLDHTTLNLEDYNGDVIDVPLGKLPLSAMTYCPHGYFSGLFYARGPARHRYQGITGSSMWTVLPSGQLDCGGVDNVKKVLKELVNQPLSRRPGKNSTGILTRDVYVGHNNQVLIRGRYRGTFLGDDVIKPVGPVTPLMERLLQRAKLRIEGQDLPTKDDVTPTCNPCSEVIW